MALRRITLRDFVIVQHLELDLAAGFTVLTGETGAGKSILIDALQLVLGARADTNVIREGATRTEICAEFDPAPAQQEWLNQAGFDSNETLLLRRTIDTQGKSRAWINGSPATATQLREIADFLLDIHGQHAWQSLMRADSIRTLLDAYAGVDSSPLMARWQAWRAAAKKLADARHLQNSSERERERLLWQLSELEKLAPAADEWQELNTQHTRLSNAQALLDACQVALGALSEQEMTANTELARAISALEQQANLEPEFEGILDVLASSLAQVEDATHSLHAYLRKTDLEPTRLAELDQRISAWMALARRYKYPPAELPLLLSTWRQELAELDASCDVEQLEMATQNAEQSYMAEAKKISKIRQQHAPKLSQSISQAMQELGMPGGQFTVQLNRLEQASAHGWEEVEFLVAAHIGVTPRPIAKVASGGELSRLALAIAVTTSQLGAANTLIFDEVDTGIGGAVAQTVGRLMQQLGRDRQVLAVTHLPQVAAYANQHIVVSKVATAAGTHSSVLAVDGEARVAEIARMLGGDPRSKTTLAHAREMLQVAPLS